MSGLIRSQTVTVRKPHRCFGCCKTIPVGAKAKYQYIKDLSDSYGLYICEDCIAFEKTLPADYWIDGGYSEGELAIAKQEREKEVVRPSLDRAELFSQS